MSSILTSQTSTRFSLLICAVFLVTACFLAHSGDFPEIPLRTPDMMREGEWSLYALMGGMGDDGFFVKQTVQKIEHKGSDIRITLFREKIRNGKTIHSETIIDSQEDMLERHKTYIEHLHTDPDIDKIIPSVMTVSGKRISTIAIYYKDGHEIFISSEIPSIEGRIKIISPLADVPFSEETKFGFADTEYAR